MPDGVVIDANVVSKFYPELVRDSGPTYQMICHLCKTLGLAASEKMLAEWQTTCAAQMMIEWITDRCKDGSIRGVKPKLDRRLAKKLLNHYGLPRNSMDIEYVKCANVTTTKYIVSEDIHLYDPKLRDASASAKARAKDQRKGALCRFLYQELGITVGTTCHCCCDFGIAV